MRRIYLDYASLTPIDHRVLHEMKVFYDPKYANPSSIYSEGVLAKKALNEARTSVADFINAHSDEVIFTSGGTEANAIALEGVARAVYESAYSEKSKNKLHMIISDIEHSSIIETSAMMERLGVEVTRIKAGQSGVVSAEEVRKAIKPNTFLISIMLVNNEIGTIQPITAIAKAIRWARSNVTNSNYPLFHTDASQGLLYENINVDKLGVDLLTLDSGKVYGPRGIGALYIRRDTPIKSLVNGGGQENGMRSGTENIPATKGFAKALELVSAERESEFDRIAQLNHFFLTELKKIKPNIVRNPGITDDTSFAPHILNVSIPNIDNEFFILQLDVKGVSASTKSSCLHDSDESYVLSAIGTSSQTSVRFSFGRWTKKADIKATIKIIANILG